MSEQIPAGPNLAEELARCVTALGPGFDHLKRIIASLQAEADAQFSHSICPSCLTAHYGELLAPDACSQ